MKGHSCMKACFRGVWPNWESGKISLWLRACIQSEDVLLWRQIRAKKAKGRAQGEMTRKARRKRTRQREAERTRPCRSWEPFKDEKILRGCFEKREGRACGACFKNELHSSSKLEWRTGNRSWHSQRLKQWNKRNFVSGLLGKTQCPERRLEKQVMRKTGNDDGGGWGGQWPAGRMTRLALSTGFEFIFEISK